MRAKHVLILFALLFLFSPLTIAQKKSPNDLPPVFKKWLEEEVVYIITSLEKDVFLQLDSDRERELFIEAFWKQRDPTPGTPQNEFKEEHYERIQYANYTFGRSAPIPGWKTDRGRFYILLGEPNDIERFMGETQIYNTEVWFYQGLSKYGLPAGFNLVFYQKGGAGDYLLYSPLSDGPQALLTSYMGDQANYLEAFRKVKQVSPSLARVSLSLIPGEPTQFGQPSLASDMLLNSIQALPEKEIKDIYAQKFLMYKDIIDVEYTANYIPSDSVVRVFKDSSEQYFVHYSIEINRFSVHEFENKYTTNLKINGQITDLEGKTIYQYEDSIPVELTEDQLRSIAYKPFDLYDVFPLIPGSFKFSVLLKNEASQEFTSLEKEIIIPEEEPNPRLSQLLLGYQKERSPSQSLKPFKVGDFQVLSQSNQTFLMKDRMFLFFQVLGGGPELRLNGSLSYEISKQEEFLLSNTKKVGDYSTELSINEEFPLEDLSPGTYWLTVTLKDGDRILDEKKEHFDITPVANFPRPWVFSKTLHPFSHPSYASILGRQYFSQGNAEKALAYLEKAFHSQPNSQDYAIVLARVYLSVGQPGKAKTTLLPFRDSAEGRYELYLFLGQAHQALGEFQFAIPVFRDAITRYGMNIPILNALGECYFRLGNNTEALAAWNKSLEINPDQQELKEKVKSLTKNL
jgi:GWxTD domain-containing protein